MISHLFDCTLQDDNDKTVRRLVVKGMDILGTRLGPNAKPNLFMMQKKLLRPERRRQIPAQFSWLDHRLVRDNRLATCDPPALALYLVLVTVSDAQGLSYYSEAALARLIQVTPDQLIQARQQLIAADLIAYRKPLYQVLALDTEPASSRSNAPQSAGQILRQILGGGQ
jgi:hypothetical protein